MIQGLYNSAAAIDAMETWNDVITRNISAGTVPGYRREIVSFEGVAGGLMDAGVGVNGVRSQGSVAPLATGTVSSETGELRRTDDPTEFAIAGSGFFRLQRPDGQHVFTRDGQFRVSPEGELLSKQGYPIAGESGSIQLLTDAGPPLVDREGRVWQGDQEVGVLSVYDFANPRSLVRTPGGFAIDPNNPQAPQVQEFSNVQQGFLEMSNVSPVREMVNLVTISNALQANQRVISNIDELTGRAVQVLGNTTS